MRISQHGRSTYGDADFTEGQIFRLQVCTTARLALHRPGRTRNPALPTNQSPLGSTRYTSPTG